MAKQEEILGIIRPNELYTLEALKRCLGIKDATLRAARRAGLQVHYKHGRGFVKGRDWIAYVCAPIEQLPELSGIERTLTDSSSAPLQTISNSTAPRLAVSSNMITG